MPLIQDIRRSSTSKPQRQQQAARVVIRTALKVHQATQLGNLNTPLSKQARSKNWHRLSEFMQYPLIAALALSAAYSSAVGQLVIGLYLVLALLFRINSRFSFGAVLLLLISIPGFQALNLTGVAENAAIYTYELLIAGTLQIIVELALNSHKPKLKSKPKPQLNRSR